MPRRRLQNENGQRAELQVAMDIIATGAAINSMTGDDTGWDLHAHLPDPSPVPPGLKHESWAMSGRTALVQVKNGDSPTISAGHLRSYLTATELGTPTIIANPRDNGDTLRIVTPGAFSDLIGDSADESVVSLSGATRPLPAGHRVETLGRLLGAWSRHARLLLHPSCPPVTRWIIDQSSVAETREGIDELFYQGTLGALRATASPVPEDGVQPAFDVVRSASRFYRAIVDEHDLVEMQQRLVEESSPKYGDYTFSSGGLPAAVYAEEWRDLDDLLRQLGTVLDDLLGHVSFAQQGSGG